MRVAAAVCFGILALAGCEREDRPLPDMSEGKPLELAPLDGGFRVKLPPGSSSKRSELPVQTDAGTFTATMHLTLVSDDAYNVGYTDYPQALIAMSDPQALLEGACNGGVSRISGTLDRKEPFTLQGHPGLRCWYHGQSKGATIHARTDLLLVHNRMFQLQFLSQDKASLTAKNTRTFFDSFELDAEWVKQRAPKHKSARELPSD